MSFDSVEIKCITTHGERPYARVCSVKQFDEIALFYIDVVVIYRLQHVGCLHRGSHQNGNLSLQSQVQVVFEIYFNRTFAQLTTIKPQTKGKSVGKPFALRTWILVTYKL